jgi:hypothetical protein
MSSNRLPGRRVRGVAIPVTTDQAAVSVLERSIGYNVFNPPPPEGEGVAVSAARASKRRPKVPQGITNAGSSAQEPPRNARPGAQPPLAGSGSKEWGVAPSPAPPETLVDREGNRLPEKEKEATEVEPREGEAVEDLTKGVFSAGTIPAGAILLRAVITQVVKFEGDTATIEVGTKDDPAKFFSIDGAESLPGGEDKGVPSPDFLEEAVDVIVTITAGESIQKYIAGSLAFAVYYIASKAKGKAAVVDGPAPTVESLQPSSAEIGQPSFDLHVIGTGFKEGDVIVFNGFDEPTTIVSETEVTTGVNMDVWTAPSAPLPVYVRSADGKESNELMFTFNAAPEVLSESAPPPPDQPQQRQQSAR